MAAAVAGSSASWVNNTYLANGQVSVPFQSHAAPGYPNAQPAAMGRCYSPEPPPPSYDSSVQRSSSPSAQKAYAPRAWRIESETHSAPELVARTFGYVGAGLALTTVSAVVFAPVVAPVMAASPLLMGLLGAGVMIGTLVGTVATSYQDSPGVKHLWWLGFNAAMGGLVMSALATISTAVLIKAGVVTGILAGGLMATGFLAPAHTFDGWRGPLSQFLCVLMVAGFIGGIAAAVAPGSLVAQALWSLDVWGGLLLFSAYLMYDTQQVLQKAQEAETRGASFDPLNQSLAVYLDLINLFIRLVAILNERR